MMKELSQNSLRVLTRDQLLDGVKRGQRKAILNLLEDADVHTLVLLESAGGERQLLAVGPELEHSSMEAVLAVDFDGSMPVAYFDNVTGTAGASGVRFETKGTARVRDLEQQLSEQQQGCEQALEAQHEARDQLQQLRDAEVLRSEGFKLRDLELLRCERLLTEREEALEGMEETLIERMDEHMLKSAQLEQWEEDLFARERQLLEPVPSAQVREVSAG